jgi:hypothetical protein
MAGWSDAAGCHTGGLGIAGKAAWGDDWLRRTGLSAGRLRNRRSEDTDTAGQALDQLGV